MSIKRAFVSLLCKIIDKCLKEQRGWCFFFKFYLFIFCTPKKGSISKVKAQQVLIELHTLLFRFSICIYRTRGSFVHDNSLVGLADFRNKADELLLLLGKILRRAQLISLLILCLGDLLLLYALTPGILLPLHILQYWVRCSRFYGLSYKIYKKFCAILYSALTTVFFSQ